MMITKFRKRRGSVALEFVFIAPILLLLLFGIIEFSLIMFNKQVITNAAREGARAGIRYVDGVSRVPYSEIQQVVSDYCQDWLVTFGGGGGPTIGITGTGTESQDDLIVTVSYDYEFAVLPGFIPGLGSGLNLVSQALMKLE